MSGDPQREFHFSPRANRAHEIDWRPWSAEAFEEAAAQDRPILLSISAVWCHWCHVMDETTYSDQGVIDVVNSEYVPVRVDNDVRPDINQRYNMGGWPTTAFLTPEGDLLTGGTYLPPDQMQQAASKVATIYRTQKEEIEARTEEGRQRAGATVAASAGTLDPGLVDRILGAAEGAYDEVNGGFGSAPKFPQTEALLLLAEQAALRGEPRLLEMARHTLAQMAGGGTYDHVEGGFFRYSTTADWSVPHFEKMLEDHAGLLSALAHTGQGDVLDDASRYLDTVLRDADTGLYAGSQDADEHYYGQDAGGRATLATPYVDRRVYASWNCQLAVGFLEADRLLDRPVLRGRADQLLTRLFADLYEAGSGMGHLAGVGGQLGDQVWALLAAVRAYSAGLGEQWRDRAVELVRHLEGAYGDPELGGYFDHDANDPLGRLRERLKPLPENATAAIGLLELDALLGDPAAGHRDRARRALESVSALATRYGLLGAVFARALDRLLRPAVEVATGSAELARTAARAHPYAVIEPAGDERATVCVGTSCLAPTADPEHVREAVTQAAAVRG